MTHLRLDEGRAAAVEVVKEPANPMTPRGPLHVRHATIRDFRGIDLLELDFPEGDAPGEGGVLVLGGDNGFGKTTVLEALALGLGRGDLLPPDSAPLAEQVRFGCKEFSIALRVAHDGDDSTLFVHHRQVSHADLPAAADVPVTHYTRQHAGRTSIANAPGGPNWQAVNPWEPRVAYVSARRDPEWLGAPSPVPRIAGMASWSTGAEEIPRGIAALKKTLVSLYNRQRGRPARPADGVPDRFERLQHFVRRFLGEDATVDVMFVDDSDRNGQDVVLRRGELPAGVETLAAARARSVERGDVPVVLPIDRLSSGQLALFAFAEPLLFSVSPPDVALIDEPERHLHVQWQRVIVSALRALSPATQLVVATHSLELMQSVTSAELAYLLPRGDPRRKANGAPAAELPR